jgi:ArsR family transcriptional regulator
MWSVCRSIILELNMSLNFLSDKSVLPALAKDEIELARAIPDEWSSSWHELWGRKATDEDFLEIAAFLANALFGDDYDQMTLKIRELTLDEVYLNLSHQVNATASIPISGKPLLDEISTLFENLVRQNYSRIGLPLSAESEYMQRMMKSLSSALRIIAGGDLHTRFWQLLDRFYYQYYQPWRKTRLSSMELKENKLLTILGSDDQVPDLSWLPSWSPLLRFPELHTAVLNGSLHITFWSEPFGLADSWSGWPGEMIVSFSEAGKFSENFETFARDVAQRASALADPTRLIILRIIRNFGMFNTEIAKFLNLSQPTVSVHTKILREAGLIQSRQEGRLVRHEVNSAELRRLFKDLERFLDLTEEH